MLRGFILAQQACLGRLLSPRLCAEAASLDGVPGPSASGRGFPAASETQADESPRALCVWRVESWTHRQDCNSKKQGWPRRPPTLPGGRDRRLDSELPRAPAALWLWAPRKGVGHCPLRFAPLAARGSQPQPRRAEPPRQAHRRPIRMGSRSRFVLCRHRVVAAQSPETPGSLRTRPAKRHSPVGRRFWARRCREASGADSSEGGVGVPRSRGHPQTRQAWASPDRAARAGFCSCGLFPRNLAAPT